jgi:sugar (pentulose or hexulose) kinase
MTKYLLGIDAGTSVIKAAVFSETGTEMSRGAGTVPIINPSPNEAEEDMHRVWSAAATAIREAIVGSSVRPSEIVAVSVTGQGDGSWLIDENGKPKGNAILWTDGRTGKIIDQWYEDGTISKQFKTSGLGPYAGTASAVLRWRKDNQPENLEGATQLWAKDWIAYNLTDDISTDGSDASLAGIDVRTRQWDDSVLETFGIKDIKHVLPPIKESTDLAGEVTAKAAGQTGLKAGIQGADGHHGVLPRRRRGRARRLHGGHRHGRHRHGLHRLPRRRPGPAGLRLGHPPQPGHLDPRHGHELLHPERGLVPRRPRQLHP